MNTALPTASSAYGLEGPSATATVDNATPQGSTYQRGNSVQTFGTTSVSRSITSAIDRSAVVVLKTVHRLAFLLPSGLPLCFLCLPQDRTSDKHWWLTL